MKKTFSIIALCLIITLCIPSVPCLAFDSFNIKTQASVSGFWSDQLDDNIQKSICSCPEDMVERVYTALDTLTRSEDLPNYLLFLNYNQNNSVGSRYGLTLYTWDSDYDLIFYLSSSAASGITSGGMRFLRSKVSAVDGNVVRFKQYSCNGIDGESSITWSNLAPFSSNSGTNCYYSNLVTGSVLDGNGKALAYDNFVANNISISSGMGSSQANTVWSNKDNSSLSNYLSDLLPYENSDGNIVTPVQVESNANHMYFQNCDLGFCEPTDIKNFTSFGGAYLYCKYTLDNWVINHINDYQLQFNVVAAIGSEQNNFSYSMRVDRNGFVTIPFSYIFQSQSSSAIPINRGFAAVVTNQKLGSDYNIAHLYSVANSNVPNFIRTLGAEYNYNLTDLGWSALKGGTLKYLCAWVSDGGTISMNNLAEWSENVAQSFNPYILRVNVKLVSGNDVSGDYAEKFDLYAGDQSTVDTGGLVNNDPFVPVVDQDDGDLPELPQDPNSTTPSTIVYTGGTFTGNFNGVIGYDPGYRDLKADLDADPDDNFTQYLAPFKNNEVGGFVGDFLDDMPIALKSIFVGGFGVLTLLGIYRFIRRG